LQAPKPKLDIPVPRINNVETYDKDIAADYDASLSYVRYHRPTPDEWKDSIGYVADEEDETWIKEKSKVGESTDSSPKLPLSLFEAMIDVMEKETALDMIISVNQADRFFQCRIPQLYELFPVKPSESGEITIKTVINDVYNYWVQKRSKLKRPLLRRFWPVTSTEDTNPHLVFRPREKEKYKLRKKRQNDANAYRKMKQLRDDFDNLRAVLDLARKREEVSRLHLKLQIELFVRRLYDAIDTSGKPRENSISSGEIQAVLSIPNHFNLHHGGRNAQQSQGIAVSTRNQGGVSTGGGISGPGGLKINVAGRNHGEPAPNFLQPLATRESYTHTWEDSQPSIPFLVDGQEVLPTSFRQRPRIGRGGRICIDRLPAASSHSINVYTVGKPLPVSSKPKRHLLELLPPPIDRSSLSRKIESAAVALVKEDQDARVIGDPADENDSEEVVVPLEEWLDTDEQAWGEERYVIGPL
jgi:enhancer of polycomb-like protein